MESIKRYFIDKKEEIKKLEVKNRLIDIPKTKGFIISVIGPRRSGKTFFLYDIIKNKLKLRDEEYIFVNFEEILNPGNPYKYIEYHEEIYGKEPKYLFFDEIQALKNWQKVVYFFHEKKRYEIFITGSSSKLLSKEIATQLRGRSVPLRLFPFSITEILSMESMLKNPQKISSYEIGKIKNRIKKVILSQYPDIILGNIKPELFFETYVSVLIYKDIIERFGIRNRFVLELFTKKVIASMSRKFSIHKVFRDLKSQNIKISKKTLYNFQKLLEDVQIVFFLRKYSRSIKKIELSKPKIHLVDPGLYNYMIKKDIGKTFENVVFLELLKNGFLPNKNIFYYETQTGEEIDFLIKKRNSKPYLIEVSYELDKSHIEKVIEAMKELKIRSSMIITWDEESVVKKGSKTIQILPFWKWVLTL